MLEVKLYHYLAVSAILFGTGMIGVLTRRNAIVVFMCVELMLNAVNLTLVAFSRYIDNTGDIDGAKDGSMLVFFVMCVAAAEAVVGLAIVLAMFRSKQDIDVNNFNIFKW